MSLRQEPPAAVLDAIRREELNGRPLLLTTRCDLSPQGAYESQWLLVDEKRVTVVREQPAAVLQAFDVDKIEEFRTSGEVGSGFLQARVDGGWVDLVRFSNTLSDRFSKVAAKLEMLRLEGELRIAPDEERDDRHCERCGMALSFAGDVCPRCVPRRAIASRVWELIKPHWTTTLWMLGMLAIAVIIELVPPKLQQYLVDDVLDIRTPHEVTQNLPMLLLVIVGALAMARVIGAVASIWKGILAARIGTSLTAAMRIKLVRKLQELSIGYYDRHQDGALVNRVAYDSEAMHHLIYHCTAGFLMQILQLIGIGIMLFWLNSELALLVLIPMPLVFIGSWIFWRYIYPRHYCYWESAAKQAGTLTSMLAGIRVVKAFAQEEREYDRFRRSSEDLRESRVQVESSSAVFGAVMQVVFGLGALIVWYFGGRDVLSKDMSLGVLMAFLAYLAMFYTPLSTLAELTTWVSQFLSASQRMFELLDTPVDIRDPAEPVPLPQPVAGKINFEEVSFGYEPHHKVLKNISFEIEAGQMIGIVGRSGSGKSTLVNLIARFYDVDAGRITIDGIDIRDARVQDIRNQVGMVLQDPYLFKGTVTENISYGKPGAGMDDIIHAARAANAHDFISRMPFGYDTAVGERGSGLSGGERQRVSIARALLYNPRVLILDEATSSVDTQSESTIQEALERFAKGRTTIAIAHRLSTLRNVDRILVFDRGALVESGTHDELLATDGIYAELVRIQSRLTREELTVDLLEERRDEEESGESAVPDPLDPNSDRLKTRWLEPGVVQLVAGPRGNLMVVDQDGSEFHDVTVLRAFPANFAREWLCLRADREGEREIGMIRRLDDWPAASQKLVAQALSRRYLLREITKIRRIELKFGFVEFDVETDAGPTLFMMRWSQPNAVDYGSRGKLIIDADSNRFLIPDVEGLPERERTRFRRYIYW